MFELEQIRQFVAFADHGTLSAAAESLSITQPALSRSMKKLEDDLGIALFDRTKNKIALNDTATFLLNDARAMLKYAESFAEKGRVYELSKNRIALFSAAPVPIYMLSPILSNVFPQTEIITKIECADHMFEFLKEDKCQLIAVPYEVQSDEYICKKLITEELIFSVPANHRFADREELSFAEINGETLLSFKNIGMWRHVHEQTVPDCNILYQDNFSAFAAIANQTDIPYFTSYALMKYFKITRPGSKLIKVTDKEAVANHYLVCKKSFFDKSSEIQSVFNLI
jgi:DNA-binding transcriptional LysR family regulator